MESPLHTDALFFAEDPGAANVMSGLAASLRKSNYRVVIVAAGTAVEQFARLGMDCWKISGNLEARDLIARFAPALLVMGSAQNDENLGLKLIAEGKRLGITTVGVVDGSASVGFRFRGDGDTPFSYAPDHLFVPNEVIRREYVKAGFQKGSLLVAGHPHYDRTLAEYSLLKAVDRAGLKKRLWPEAGDSQPVVVFLSEISFTQDHRVGNPEPEYELKGRGKKTKRTSIVIEEFLDAVSEGDLDLFKILRLHPKNRPEDFQEYLPEFDVVSDRGLPYEVVYAADLVVGLTTILLEEASIFGRPVLSILTREKERKWLTGIDSGVIPFVHKREDILPAIKGLLAVEGVDSDHQYRPSFDSTGRISGLLGQFIESRS